MHPQLSRVTIRFQSGMGIIATAGERTVGYPAWFSSDFGIYGLKWFISWIWVTVASVKWKFLCPHVTTCPQIHCGWSKNFVKWVSDVSKYSEIQKKKHSFWPLLLQTKKFPYFWCWRVLYLSRMNITLLEWKLFRFFKKFRYHSVTRAGKGRKTRKHELKNEKVNIEQSSRCRRDLVWAS